MPLSSVPRTTTVLDVSSDVTSLTAAICDIESVSRNEAPSRTPSRRRCGRSVISRWSAMATR